MRKDLIDVDNACSPRLDTSEKSLGQKSCLQVLPLQLLCAFCSASL